jgi:molybdopterin converting factor small subunit
MQSGTPPCQNIMFPPLPLYNYNYNEHSSKGGTPPLTPYIISKGSEGTACPQYQYQPIINIPTRTSTATLGEVGASVELVKAHVLELSKRMESIEYKFSEFEKRASNDISLLKNTLLEHSAELLKMGDSVDNTLAHVKSTNALIEQQDACIDKLTDAFYEHNRVYIKRQQQNVIKKIETNVDLGMIRRRLSKVEEFTGEFYEHFENFKSVKDIISDLSDHVTECDRDISLIVKTNIETIEGHYENNNDNDIVASTLQHAVVSDLDNYFSNYDDNEDDHDNINSLEFMKNDQEQQNVEEDDDFEKL